MIWHHREFMQQVFALLSMVEENVDKELSHPIRLQNVSLLKGRSRDEVTSMSGGAAKWRGHQAPRRLEAACLLSAYRSAESAAPTWGK